MKLARGCLAIVPCALAASPFASDNLSAQLQVGLACLEGKSAVMKDAACALKILRELKGRQIALAMEGA